MLLNINEHGNKPVITGKDNFDHAPQGSVRGSSSPSSRPWAVRGEPLMMRGQCDARPAVTFPAARYHRPLAGTKLYCLVTEARVLTTCPGLHSTAEWMGFKSSTIPLHHRASRCYWNWLTWL